MVNINSVGLAYNDALQQLAAQMGISIGLLTTLMSLIAIWTLVWKGLALWKAAMKKQKLIFILLLVLNDFGIIELLYYFWLSKIGENKKEQEKVKFKQKKSKK